MADLTHIRNTLIEARTIIEKYGPRPGKEKIWRDRCQANLKDIDAMLESLDRPTSKKGD